MRTTLAKEKGSTGMIQWDVTAVFDGDALNPVDLGSLTQALSAHDAFVANTPKLHQFTVAISDHQDGPEKCIPAVLEHVIPEVAKVRPTAQLVAVEAVSSTELDRRLSSCDLPDLVSAAQACKILGGISRQRLHQLSLHDDNFPEPLQNLGKTKLWLREAIEVYARSRSGKPGRPHRST